MTKGSDSAHDGGEIKQCQRPNQKKVIKKPKSQGGTRK